MPIQGLDTHMHMHTHTGALKLASRSLLSKLWSWRVRKQDYFRDINAYTFMFVYIYAQTYIHTCTHADLYRAETNFILT